MNSFRELLEGKEPEITKIETGTTFKTKSGYLISIERIWVESVHMPHPTTWVAYSFTPLEKGEGKKSGKEQNSLENFIKNILKD